VVSSIQLSLPAIFNAILQRQRIAKAPGFLEVGAGSFLVARFIFCKSQVQVCFAVVRLQVKGHGKIADGIGIRPGFRYVFPLAL